MGESKIFNTAEIMDANRLNHLRSLVREVGRDLINIWPGKSNRPLIIRNKKDDTPVTEADDFAHRVLAGGIHDLFPEDIVLSEEGNPNYTEAQFDKNTWIMDPLDGTRCFIQGGNDFSILVGRVLRGVCNYGIMYFPILGLFAEARLGGGAFVNGIKINASLAQDFSTARYFSRPRSLGNFSGNVDENFVTGRALLAAARGEVDLGFFKFDKFSPHDFAAPSIILKEAGGLMINELGEDFRLTPGSAPSSLVVGSNLLCHQVLSRFKGSTR